MDTHHLQRRASSHSSLSKGPEGRSKQRETETRRDENQEVDDVHLQSGDDEEDVQDSACDQEESCVSECQSTGVSVPRYEGFVVDHGVDCDGGGSVVGGISLLPEFGPP